MSASPPLPSEDLEQVDAQVDGAWERLRGKNLFLTGGSGFFGSWLLETLLFAEDKRKLGVKVWALSRSAEKFRAKLPHLAGHPVVRLVDGGVEGFAFPAERMNFVIHSMVADPGMPLEKMEKWFGQGTGRLLDLAGRGGCEGFLLCSTGAVYQSQKRPVSEEDPLVPLEGPLTYGRIRRQVEEQCLEACQKHGIPLKIARGFAFVGPRLPENAGFAMADFLGDAAAGRPIRVKGDGQPVRSYLYAADMAVWLLKILLTWPSSGVYNVGSEEGVRLADLASRVASRGNIQVVIEGRGAAVAAQKKYYVPVVKKAVKTFGALPSRNLESLLPQKR